MSSLSSILASGIDEVRRSWLWFFLCGIALVVLGAACIVKAESATRFSILALGWVLIISAIVWLIGTFQTLTWGGFFVYLLNALVRGVTGYLLITHPNAGAEGITMVLAALFIVGGLFRIFGASAIQYPRWGWTVFAGLVSVGLGVYLLANWSTTSTFFIGIAIGVDLVLDGASLLGFAGAIHSLPSATARTREA
jgi:uncharacterized membrane protein HdeD (DUF308 family)